MIYSHAKLHKKKRIIIVFNDKGIAGNNILMALLVGMVAIGFAFVGGVVPANIAYSTPIPTPTPTMSAPCNPTPAAPGAPGASGAPAGPQPNPQSPTATCGKKSTAPSGNAPGFSCTGKWGTTPTSDGYYVPTYFGCSKGFPKDPGDNCIAACGSIPECNGVTGRACEEKLQWFAADAGRYGCNTKLKVTNPATGKAVIVRAIDQGPSCSVEKGRGKMDISQAAYTEIGASSMVQVEKVAESTPLGPIPECK
jgi:hypothetical protein